MADEKSSDKDTQEEPSLTRLVPSDDILSSKAETWQLSSFDRSLTDLQSVEEPNIPEEVYLKIQQEMQPELQKQADILKKEAYDAAYKLGYEEGLAQGAEVGQGEAKELALQANQEALTPKIEQLDKLLSVLKVPYDKLEKQVLSELTDLALHMAHKVIQKELLDHKDWMLETVQEAVKALPESSAPFQVELHPDDLKGLNELELPFTEQWELKANANLAPGACLVKRGDSSVLNSWQARFDELASHLHSKASRT